MSLLGNWLCEIAILLAAEYHLNFGSHRFCKNNYFSLAKLFLNLKHFILIQPRRVHPLMFFNS